MEGVKGRGRGGGVDGRWGGSGTGGALHTGIITHTNQIRPVALCFIDPWWLHIRRRKGTRYPARVEKARRRSDTKSSDSTREEVDEGVSSFKWEEEGGGQEQWARRHLIMSASTGAIFHQTQ